MLEMTAIQGSTAAATWGSQGAGMEQPTAASQNWYGAVSSEMVFAGDIMQAASMRSSARDMRQMSKRLYEMAVQAMKQGIESGIDVTHEGAQSIGRMTAAFGKSGSLLEGSPLLTLADEARDIEINVARAIEQGRIRSEAYRFQAKQAAKQAQRLETGSNWTAALAPVNAIADFYKPRG